MPWLDRRGEKVADGSFRSTLQDNMSSNGSFQEETGAGSGQVQWRSENYMLHGILGSENQHHQHSGFENRPVNNDNYHNYGTVNYGLTAGDHPSDHQQLLHSNNWSKVPQFLRVTPQKQPQSQTGQLQFSNNAPFWNATGGTARPSLFHPVQARFSAPSFDEKPKVWLEIGHLNRLRLSGNQQSECIFSCNVCLQTKMFYSPPIN